MPVAPTTAPAASSTPAVAPPLVETMPRADLAAYLAKRLTGASGGVMPDGSPRWTADTDRDRRYRPHLFLVHKPTGARVEVVTSWDKPLNPIRLRVADSDMLATSRTRTLSVGVGRNGDGDYAKLAAHFSLLTVERAERRERDRLHTAKIHARVLTLREAVMKALLDAGCPVASATEVKGASETDTGNDLPSLTWGPVDAQEVAFRASIRIRGGSRASLYANLDAPFTPDPSDIVVCAGTTFNRGGFMPDRVTTLAEAVRIVRATLAAAEAYAALTPGEDANASGVPATGTVQ